MSAPTRTRPAGARTIDELLADARAGIGNDLDVVILCSEGYTSSLAADALRSLGLHRATDVIGGFQAWRKDPLVGSIAGSGTT